MVDPAEPNDLTQAWTGRLLALSRVPIAPLLYVLWKYRLGMDAVVRSHDNLEHFVPVYDRMSLGDVFAPPGRILDFVLGGLPRDMAGSEFFLGLLFGALLPLVWSLVLSDLTARLIAYYGMRRLLRSVGLESDTIVYLGVPIVFSLLPFLPAVVGAVAGIPLLASALINLHRRAPSRADWLILALFPMISWSAATIPYVGIISIYAVAAVSFRLVPRAVLRGAGVLVASLVVVEWRLIKTTMLGPESHRLEMGSVGPVFDLGALSGSVFRLGRRALEVFEKHFIDAPTTLVPLTVVMIVCALAVLLGSRNRVRRPGRLLAGSLVVLALIGVVSGLWPFVLSVAERVVAVPPIQFDRLAWAAPGVVFIAVAAAGAMLIRALPRVVGSALVGVVLVVQGVVAVEAADFANAERAVLTIDEFYAPDQFDEVARLIGPSADHVVSIGFHPQVAVANGFDAADGYWYNYPLDYKDRFRRLIAPALDHSASLQLYFDGWGSRAYVFQSELGPPPCCQIRQAELYTLMVDETAFGDLRISHVLSHGGIRNWQESGLGFVGRVDGDFYDIYVYSTGVRP